VLSVSSSRRATSPTRFPYTTLFRSRGVQVAIAAHGVRATPEPFAFGAELDRPQIVQVAAFGMKHLAENAAADQIQDQHLAAVVRSEEHTSELQSPDHLVCRLLLENK